MIQMNLKPGGQMAELLERIGHNVRRLREEKDWNQTELGFRADMSPSIISLIENGKRNPSTATLAKIADALGVEVVDLFPKVSALPPEPSFEELMDAERRGGATDADIINGYERIMREHRIAWRDALNALAEPWEERLATGAFDRGSVEQFFADVAAISPSVARAGRAAVEEYLAGSKYKAAPTRADVEEMWATGSAEAGARLLGVVDAVYAAAAEKFSTSELEALRHKHDQARRALGQAAA
jgi:transcriptional regulator with XRE-family HTH domain